MSKVVAIMSLSLDGYLADLNHGVVEVPAFVLTHHVPAGWPRPDSTVHFVTDGIESAVNQAKTSAAGKSVGGHGADTIQPFQTLLSVVSCLARRGLTPFRYDDSETTQ